MSTRELFLGVLFALLHALTLRGNKWNLLWSCFFFSNARSQKVSTSPTAHLSETMYDAKHERGLAWPPLHLELVPLRWWFASSLVPSLCFSLVWSVHDPDTVTSVLSTNMRCCAQLYSFLICLPAFPLLGGGMYVQWSWWSWYPEVGAFPAIQWFPKSLCSHLLLHFPPFLLSSPLRTPPFTCFSFVRRFSVARDLCWHVSSDPLRWSFTWPWAALVGGNVTLDTFDQKRRCWSFVTVRHVILRVRECVLCSEKGNVEGVCVVCVCVLCEDEVFLEVYLTLH